MAELRPYPFAGLVTRMFTELERQETLFDLPARKFHFGDPVHDVSTVFQGHPAGCPLGPAAGPQTQMAQNIVLSWLGGSRIFELKTIQVDDELTIPRPCIDMRNVGYNAEWSQELRLPESLLEYVKGAMLVEMLQHGETFDVVPSFAPLVYDMSVGYDLAGIQSERVSEFLAGMLDTRSAVERLRRKIPPAYGRLRDLDYPMRLSDTVTLSTFHGCPPDEIARIIEHLMRTWHVHCVVKFNPMLLGPQEARHLLHDVLGYTDVSIPDSAFERDTTWDQAVEIVDRLGELAGSLGLGFGVKFTNTLIVENRAGFLPESEKEVYLSGAPLHVLAMHLVARFRRRFGDRFPISFSAGIDKENYAHAVALGLVPVTVCSDLLKTGGYGRLSLYHRRLARAMDAAGARNLDDYVLLAHGQGLAALEATGLPPDDPRFRACQEALRTQAAASGQSATAPEIHEDTAPSAGGSASSLPERGLLREAAGPELYGRWVSQAKLRNTEHHVDALARDLRYARERNRKMPPKIGSHLELFDCVTCDKCVPVCPNDANFTLELVDREIPVVKVQREGAGYRWYREGSLTLTERHQIASFADFCNECGNCDVFCPEDGGPYVVKPRFFGSEADWRGWSSYDGFFVTRRGDTDLVLGRFASKEFRLRVSPRGFELEGWDFVVRFDPLDPQGTVRADGPEIIDVTHGFIMDALRRAVLDCRQVNYVNIPFLDQTPPGPPKPVSPGTTARTPDTKGTPKPPDDREDPSP